MRPIESRVLRVPPLSPPERLDRFLVSSGEARTRSQAKRLIDAERVRVDGRGAKGGTLLRGGETIDVQPPSPSPSPPEPEDLLFTVLHQDEDVVAIDKPAGMVVHPAPGAWHGTLVNALLHRGLVAGGMIAERPGIVHRLDKETSGVLIVARNAHAHEVLSRAFHDREVKKTYLAIVLRTPRRQSGTIDWPIGRHPSERSRMSVHSARGRAAETRYSVLESFGALALLRVEPATGRTHQIRVHLAALGHPVLADPTYGARKGRARPAEGPGVAFPRQALHAAEIRFAHPSSGEPVAISAPLPADMSTLLRKLRGD